MYADDIALVAQANTLETVETTLNRDLNKLHNYFKRWYLTLNPNKTLVLALHLNNRKVKMKLEKQISGIDILSEKCLKYLDRKIDRALTFKKHFEGLKNKLKTRNNIISKLVGST